MIMKKAYSVKIEEEILDDAKKSCKKNMTTLQAQIREFMKRIAQDNLILKEEL